MLFFAWLSLFVKGALRPLTQKGGVSTFLTFILHLDVRLLKCCCEGCQQPCLQVTEAGAEPASSPCSISCLTKQPAVQCFSLVLLLTWLFGIWRLLFFHILHNVPLFQSSPVVSQFRQEEWLPRGASVWLVRAWCAWPMAELESVGCSAGPLIQRKVTTYLHGVVGEEQTTGVLYQFQLIYCGNCIWREPFESCVMWEKVSALMKH